jgi:hypothetical protein
VSGYLRVISWRTRKEGTGYVYEVYSFDYGQPERIHDRGTAPTRARAKGAAQRLVRWHKGAQRMEAAGEAVPVEEALDPMDDFNYVGSRHHY